MNLRSKKWRGVLPGAVLLAVVTSITPLSAAAADARPSAKPGVIKASVDKVAASDFAAKKTSRASTNTREEQPSPGRDGSFFKTKPGIIALAIMIAGTGYAVYSAQHDRINSPGKN